MKAQVVRWGSIIVFLLLVIGCDGGSDENPNALTVGNLQGTYDLNTDAMPGDLVDEDSLNLISGMVEMMANTLTITGTLSGMGSFTLANNTLTFTDSEGNTTDFQVTLSDTGNTLTLIVNEDGDTVVSTRRGGNGMSNEVTVANLQGMYDFDVTNTTFDDLVSGELEVVGTIMIISATLSQTGPFVIAGNTITSTDADGDTTVRQATLSNDGNTLTLVDEDDEDSNRLVFERR